jgi:glycosyltransferase involved in cell wall biosynthesis
MAGWLAGVPRIILSTRSVNPSHFPRFYCYWFQVWYQYLTQLPKVRLIGNSEAGIKDYSEWLNIPINHFSLVRNGVDYAVITSSTEEEVAQFRENLNIEEDAPLIAGIFRLDPEKRPFTFLEVIMKVKERLPKLKVVMAGIGTLDEAVRKKVAECNANNWISFLGRRQDVPLIISSCDVVLLTSSEEGTPNILLEAQWLAKPVVCTNAGGVAEVVQQDKTGYICAQDDIEGIVNACCTLLNDRELRHTFGNAGQTFVREHFSVDKMISNTLAFYNEHALVTT